MKKYYIEIERYESTTEIEISLSVGNMEDDMSGNAVTLETTHFDLSKSDRLMTVMEHMKYLKNSEEIHAIIEKVYDVNGINLLSEIKTFLK